MARPIFLRSSAQVDVREAVIWYEEQQHGLGERFLQVLDILFERIAQSPQQFPKVELEVRWGFLHRFPYAVYFINPRPRTWRS